MKIITVTKEIEEQIKGELIKFFEEETEKVEIDNLCPSKMIEYLNDLGADVSEDLDTNGWQYDYWIKFTYKNKRYCLSGGGYYGGTLVGSDED